MFNEIPNKFSLRSSMSFVRLQWLLMWMTTRIDQLTNLSFMNGWLKNERIQGADWCTRPFCDGHFWVNWFLRWSLQCPTNQLHNEIYCHWFPSNSRFGCQRAVNAPLNRPKIDLHSYFIEVQIYGINNFTKCALWLIVIDLILIFLTHDFAVLNGAQLIAPQLLLQLSLIIAIKEKN